MIVEFNGRIVHYGIKDEDKGWNGDFWKITEKGKWFSRIHEACVPNARWCNHRNSTETHGNVSIVAFEFNGRIVSCRIARLVRSIRASAINAAPSTIENRGRTVGIVLRMDPDWRRSFPRPGKKTQSRGSLFSLVVKVDQPRFCYSLTHRQWRPIRF